MNIALWGTFDLESLGDTMFPKILKEVLASRISIDEVFLFSITTVENSYNENGVVYSIDDFEEIYKKHTIDWIIISGGELLHNYPIKYRLSNGQETCTEPGYFWKKASAYALKYKIPVIVNLVGVPYEFSEDEEKELRSCVNNFCYLSVRDKFSWQKLINAGIDKKYIVTCHDGLLLFNQYYSLEFLSGIRKSTIDKNSIQIEDEYIVVQYDTTKNVELLATALQEISEEYKVQIVLLPINRCHDDVVVAQRLYEYSHGKFLNVTAYLQPIEIMSIIAGAKVFLGTSFHGSIVAMSYNVNCMAFDMYPHAVSKLDGLYDEFGIHQYLIGNIKGLKSAFREVWYNRKLTKKTSEILKAKQEELCIYYDQLAEIINKKEKMTVVNKETSNICKERKVWKKSTLEMENAAGECVCYNALGIEQGGTVEFHFHLQTKSNRLLKWYSYIDRPIEIGNIQVLGVQGTVEMSAVEGEQIGGGKWRFGGLKFEYDFDLSKSIEGDITIKCQMEELPLSIGFKTIQNVLNNKEAHIEQLLESERRLENNLRVQVIEKEKWEQRTEEKQIALKMLEHKFEKLEKHCKAMEELCKRLEDEGNQAKINCELKQTHIVNLDSIITNQHKHIEELEALQKSILESKRWKILSWISKLIPKRK